MNDYQKLHGIINEINYLLHMRVAFSTDEFTSWYANTERFLIDRYGESSYEVQNFKDKMYSIYVSACEIDNSDYDKMCKEGLITTKAILVGYLQEMRDF